MSEVILSQPDKIKLNNMVKECVDALVRIDGEKSFMKDVADRAKDELNIPPATFNAVVKERFDDSVTNRMFKLEAVVELNEELVAASRHAN